MGPRAGLGRYGNSRPNRDSNPGPSSPYRVAIQTTLSRPTDNQGSPLFMFFSHSHLRLKIQPSKFRPGMLFEFFPSHLVST